MRTLSPEFAAALGGSTTLARCFRIARRDGVVLGFTEHDRDLLVDGTLYRADTGASGSEVAARLGLSVETAEIAGIIDDDALTEADIAAGRFDEAAVEVRLVDWANPLAFVLLHAGTIGEIRRAGAGFVAELRGLAAAFDAVQGRRYTRTCDARLGDARCKVDLSAGGRRQVGVVTAVLSPVEITCSGLEGFAAGALVAGRVTLLSGLAAGLSEAVVAQTKAGPLTTLRLAARLSEAVAAGDTCEAEIGCDKAFSTCRERFGNTLNFRGFPAIPGDSYMTRVARAGEDGHDGKVWG